MKNSLTKLLCLILVLATAMPFAVACASRTGGSGEGDGQTSTTAGDDVDPVPGGDLAEALAANPYATAGYELIRQIIKDYYNTRNGFLSGDPKSGSAPAVWGAAAFIEALADAYRLYPDDTTIAKAYESALTKMIDRYKVTNATIVAPAGRTRGITYYNAGQGSSGDYYYDDNEWICIQLLIGYQQLGDEALLDAAKANLDFLWTGWDDKWDGGIYWDKTYGGKNTCSNGPGAICFLLAYQITGNGDYLEKGKMIYDWARSKLLESNLYKDSLTNGWKAAYNQATMLYAGAQLFEITGDSKYYDHAKATYSATIGLMFKTNGRGKNMTVSMNGNPIYKAWCVGWLTRAFVKYYEVDPKKNTTAMEYLEKVLDNELGTKDKKGYYDPYFLSGDWGGESVTDVLQPSGVACTFLTAGYFDVIAAAAAGAAE